MVSPGGARPGLGITHSLVLLFAAAMIAPWLVPGLFGWITGLLAIPVFFLLGAYGLRRGSILIRNAIIIACVAALLLKQTWSLLFALTLIPLGYGLHRSAERGHGEWETVLWGCLYLGTAWLVYWTAYGVLMGIQPYQSLLELIDAGFVHSSEFYRRQADIPAESLLYLEEAVREIRRLVPHILPGLLGCLVIMTVCVSLIGGIGLLDRVKPGYLTWKKFSQWRLPEWLVWPTIGAGFLLLVGGEELGIGTLAVSMTIVCGLLFMIQGLAVFIHLLKRWNVPFALRLFFYGILVVQSYGLLLLALLGLADVWIDFRRREDTHTQIGN